MAIPESDSEMDFELVPKSCVFIKKMKWTSVCYVVIAPYKKPKFKVHRIPESRHGTLSHKWQRFERGVL